MPDSVAVRVSVPHVGVGVVVGVGVGVGVGSGPPPGGAMYSSRFGEPVPGLVTLPVVAAAISALATFAGLAPGLACR